MAILKSVMDEEKKKRSSATTEPLNTPKGQQTNQPAGFSSPIKGAQTIGQAAATIQQSYQAKPVPPTKWYAGDQPTWNEAQAHIYNVSKTNPEEGQKLFNQMMFFSTQAGNPLYRPYIKPTSSAIVELGKLGIDASKVDDNFIQENAYLLNGATYGTNGTITKGKTAESKAAYWYSKLLDDEQTTKKAEQEYAAWKEEVTYWSSQTDRNYSDAEIESKIDLKKKYPTLYKMMDAKSKGEYTSLTRAVDFDTDQLGGYTWAARNNGGTGSIAGDTYNSLSGNGNVWTRNANVKEALELNPYATGSTMDDARLYYGVSSFDKKWLDNNPIKDPNDATEIAMRKKVQGAITRTEKTLEQYSKFMGRLDARLENCTDASQIDLDRLLEDYSSLQAIDDSIETGKLLDFSEAVPYSRQMVERYIRDKVNENVHGRSLDTFDERMAYLLTGYIGMDEGGVAVQDAKSDNIRRAGEVILDDGTPMERQAFLAAGEYSFDQYWLPKFVTAVQNGEIDGQAAYQTAVSAADKFADTYFISDMATVSDYMKLTDELAVYEQSPNYMTDEAFEARIAELDQAILMDPDNAYALEKEKAQLEQGFYLNTDKVVDLNRKIEKAQAGYDEAVKRLEQAQTNYAMAATIANVLGVKLESTPTREALSVAAAFTQWQPTNWYFDTVYDTMAQEGKSEDEIRAHATKTIEDSDKLLLALDKTLETMDSRGMQVPDAIRENIARARESVERDKQAAEYYTVRDNENFASVVEETKAKIKEDKWGFASQYGSKALYAYDPFLDITASGESTSQMGLLNDAERDTYLYLLSTEGKEAAEKYYDFKTGEFGITKIRASQNLEDNARKMAGEGFFGAAGSTVLSVAGSLLNSMGFAYSLYQTIRGEEINPFDPSFTPMKFNQTVRDEVKKQINNPFWEFMYDVGCSTVDSMLNVAVFGGAAKAAGEAIAAKLGKVAGSVAQTVVGTLNMGAGAGASAGYEVALKGGNPAQELAMIAVNTLAEIVTEGLPFDNMLKILESGGENVVKSILTQALEEALEEGTSGIATTIADSLIMKDKSEMNQLIDEYINEGMSPEAAQQKAMFDTIVGIGKEMLAGAMSGGLSGTIGSFASKSIQAKRMSQAEALQKLLTNLTGENTEAPVATETETAEAVKAEAPANDITEQANDVIEPANDEVAKPAEPIDPKVVWAKKRSVLQSILEAGNSAKSAAVASVMTDGNSRREASAAAKKLIARYGGKATVEHLGMLFDAAYQLGDPSIIDALPYAVLSDDASSIVSKIFLFSSDSNDMFINAQLLQAWDHNRRGVPLVQQQVQEAVVADRVAQKEMDLIGDGAMETVDSYKQKVKDVGKEVRKAKSLVKKQAQRYHEAQVGLKTVNDQYMQDPTKEGIEAELNNAITSVLAAKEALDNLNTGLNESRARLDKAKADLKKAEQNALTQVREQAQADVVSEIQAEQQAEVEANAKAAEAQATAEAQAVAEAQEAKARQERDNARIDEAAAFVDKYFPKLSKQARDSAIQKYLNRADTTAEVSIDNNAFAGAIGKKFGIKINFTDSHGLFNGVYNRTENSITLDKTATQDEAIRSIIGHELTHVAETSGIYTDIRDAIMDMYEGGKEKFDANAKAKMELYRNTNANFTLQDAEYEIVADEVGKLLSNSEYMDRLAGEKPGVVTRILEAIRDILNKLGLVKSTEVDNLRRLEKNLDNAINEAVNKKLNKDGAQLTESGTAVKHSLSSWTDAERERVRQNLIDAGYDSKRVENWIDDLNSMAALIALDPERLDFTAAEQHTMMKKNDEYVVTIDASTLCEKRRLFQGTFDAVQNAMPDRVLTSEDVIELRNLLAEMGYTSPCAICYVESRRRHLGEFADQWLQSYDGEYKPSINEVTTSDGLEKLRLEHPQTYKDFVDKMNSKGSSNPKVVQLRTDYKGDLEKLTKGQVKKIIDIGGLRIQSFSDFETPHLLDMMQVIMDASAKKLPAQAYTKVPNFAWVFGDTGIKINLSLISTGTGLDADGNLTFSDTEGMPFEEAMKLRDKYSKNVGTILVGLSKEHILAAMKDPRIDYIIPFHRSGWGSNELKMMKELEGYSDFQSEQNERVPDLDENGKKVYTKDGKLKTKALPKGESNFTPNGPNGYWDFSVDGKTNAETYLRMCNEAGRVPKFASFLAQDANGNYMLQPDGSTDGYWKTLIDFKMYDNDGVGSPQESVQPIFNMDEANRVMGEYEGGADELPVAQDVVNEYLQRKGVEQRYSLPDDFLLDAMVDNNIETEKKNADYMRAAESGDMETAQKMVDEAAKDAGYTVNVYHGTDKFGFTKIDTSKSDDGISFFTTDSIRTANTYTKSNRIRNVGEEYNTYKLEDIKNERKEAFDKELMSLSSVIDSITKDEGGNSYSYKDLTNLLEQYYQKGAGHSEIVEALKDYVFDVRLGQSLYGDETEDIVSQEDKFRKAEAMLDKVASLYLDYVDFNTDATDSGVYALAINPSGFMEVDAKGRLWNNLRYKIEPGVIGDSVSEANTTRELAEYAKAKGYNGVTFKNINDNGIYGKTYLSTVYAAFNADESVKSLDPVTYDDNGNIIPLSQRFNSSNDDIRYALPENREIPEGMGERQFAVQTGQNASIITDEMKNVLGLDENRLYERDSNEAQRLRAIERINQEGMDASFERLMSQEQFDENDVAESAVLMSIYFNPRFSNPERAQALLLNYNEHSTKAGKTLQAYKILPFLNPASSEIWLRSHFTRQLETDMASHEGAVEAARDQASRVREQVENLDSTDRMEELNQQDTFQAGADNRWNVPINAQQEALIDQYGLRNTGRPGLYYNRATTNQRILESILMTPDVTRPGADGMNLVEQIEFIRNGLPVLLPSDVGYITARISEYNSDANNQSRNAQLALARAYEATANVTPATLRDKTRSWRFISMLLSATSSMRNFMGNGFQNVVNTVAHDIVGVAVDKAVARRTGERTLAYVNAREKAQSMHDFVQEMRNTYRDYFVDRAITRPEGLHYSDNNKGRVFQNGTVELMRNMEGYLMSLGDRNFYVMAFANSMREQEHLAQINGVPFDAEAAMNQAEQDAAFAIFNEDSRLRDQLARFKREAGGAGIALDLIMPFTGVPTNIAHRMWQYNPLSLATIAVREATRIHNGETFNQRQFVNDISRAFTGTAMCAIGMGLYAMGAIKLGTGEEPDKKKYGVETALGGQYSPYITLFGANISLSALAPAVSPLIAGAAMMAAFDGDDEGGNAVLNSALVSLDQILDASYLSSLKDIFSSNGTDDSPVKKVALGIANSAVGQFIPAPISHLATAIDPYVRDTKEKNEILKIVKESVINKLPVIRSMMLPEKVDVAGRPIQNGKYGLGAFLNPFNTTIADDDPVLNDMLFLSEKYDDSSFLPSDVTSFTLNKVKYSFTREEHTEFMKYYGNLWTKNTKGIDQQPDEQSRMDDYKDAVADALKEAKEWWANTH